MKKTWAAVGVLSAMFALAVYGVWSYGQSGSGLGVPSDETHHTEFSIEDELRLARDEPPLIAADDLRRIGLDSAAIRQVTPHLSVVNAALLRLAALHTQLDNESDPRVRTQIQHRAVVVHTLADRHENFIHSALSAGERKKFHALLEARERSIGLPADFPHRESGTGEIRGVVHPPDSLEPERLR